VDDTCRPHRLRERAACRFASRCGPAVRPPVALLRSMTAPPPPPTLVPQCIWGTSLQWPATALRLSPFSECPCAAFASRTARRPRRSFSLRCCHSLGPRFGVGPRNVCGARVWPASLVFRKVCILCLQGELPAASVLARYEVGSRGTLSDFDDCCEGRSLFGYFPWPRLVVNCRWLCAVGLGGSRCAAA